MGRYLRVYRSSIRPSDSAAAARHVPDPAVRQAFRRRRWPRPLHLPPHKAGRSTGRSSSSATRAAAPPSCTGCSWEPAGWPPSSCGRCSSRPSRRASCSVASSRASTGCRPRVTTLRTCTTRACAASRPMTVLWFFRTLDGPFAWAYFLAWQDTWGSELSRREFGIEGVTARDERSLLPLLRGVLATEPVLQGAADRILAKTSMLTFASTRCCERYPDCKLVYIIRDPVEVIPSGMSLLAGVLENGYDVWNRTRKEDQRRWIENLYQASCEMLRSSMRRTRPATSRNEPLRGALLGPPPGSRADD